MFVGKRSCVRNNTCRYCGDLTLRNTIENDDDDDDDDGRTAIASIFVNNPARLPVCYHKLVTNLSLKQIRKHLKYDASVANTVG